MTVHLAGDIPLKFNMVHLKINPSVPGDFVWKPVIQVPCSIFGGVIQLE